MLENSALRQTAKKSERGAIPWFLIFFLTITGIVITQILFNLINYFFGTTIPRFAGLFINGAVIALAIIALFRIVTGAWIISETKDIIIMLLVFGLIVAFLIYSPQIPVISELYSTKYLFSASKLFALA